MANCPLLTWQLQFVVPTTHVQSTKMFSRDPGYLLLPQHVFWNHPRVHIKLLRLKIVILAQKLVQLVLMLGSQVTLVKLSK